MLIKNLDLKQGLVNGTRLRVLQCKSRTILCIILNGPKKGSKVHLFPVDQLCDLQENVLKFRRRQLPIKLSFAMTINKSQGQTFDMVGLYLKSNLFMHGQLYVAMSRVKNSSSFKIQMLQGVGL